MKTLYYSLLVFLAAASITGCNDYKSPDIPDVSAIEILSRETSFPAAASTGIIEYESKEKISVTSKNEWLTASVDGNKINIAVEQNNEVSGRSGFLSVKCGNATEEITIFQSGVIFSFASTTEVDIESTAWQESYDIVSNVPIEVSSDVDWLSGSAIDGLLTINAERNPNLIARSGQLTIKAGNTSCVFIVNQAELNFPLIKIKALNVGNDASTLTYDCPEGINFNMTTDDAWIHLASKDDVIEFSFDDNNSGHIRTGEISYTFEGMSGKIAISQYDFDTQIAGTYRFYFTNSRYKNPVSYSCTFGKNGNNYELNLAGYFKIPVEWDAATMTFKVNSGCLVGRFTSYNAFVAFLPSEDTAVPVVEDAYMTAKFTYSEAKGVTVAQLEADKPELTYFCIAYYPVGTTVITDASAVMSYYQKMDKPYLQK